MKVSHDTKKIIASVGVAVCVWHTLAGVWSSVPAVPEVITKPLIAGISPLALAGLAGAYALIMLWSDY